MVISASQTVYIYNNTVVDCDNGINAFNGTLVASNNIAFSNVDNYDVGLGSFDVSSTNNLSGPGGDSDIPPANARNGATVTFVNAGTDDFHLDSNDSGARTYGADLSSDPSL